MQYGMNIEPYREIRNSKRVQALKAKLKELPENSQTNHRAMLRTDRGAKVSSCTRGLCVIKAQEGFPVRAEVRIFMTIDGHNTTQILGKYSTCGHITTLIYIHPYPSRLAWKKLNLEH